MLRKSVCRLPLIAVGLMALGVGAPAVAAVTFGTGLTAASAYAHTAVGTTANSGNGTDGASVTTLPADPVQSDAATDSPIKKRGAVAANASAEFLVTETFVSASSGSFNFLGTTSASVVPADSTNNAYAYDSGTASYYFSLDQAATLNVTFDLVDSNSNGNLRPYVLYLAGTNYEIGSNSSGSLSTLLGPGSYVLSAYTDDTFNHDFVYQLSTGSQSGASNDTFAWSLTSAAPEPMTWAMMLMGLGGLGGVLRTRRRSSGLVAAA